MSTEALQTQTPEQTLYSTEAIRIALGEARESLNILTTAPTLQTLCVERGIDPTGEKDPQAYWRTVAELAYNTVQGVRAEHGTSLELDAFELISATPSFVYEHFALDHHTLTNNDKRHDAKRVASYYNATVRNFAYTHPEASAHDISGALLATVNEHISDSSVQRTANTTFHNIIRGAQHELAFGQLLEATGRPYWPAGLEEDLAGIDYTVEGTEGHYLNIDVKASLSEIENKGASNETYACKPDGNIVMFSLVQDKELHDKFFLPEESVNLKAPVLHQILGDAQHRQVALQRALTYGA